MMQGSEMPPILPGQPHVILIVGVNGSGKTTSIGKLAHYYTTQGKTVLMAAADTFRAAAGEQLANDALIKEQYVGIRPAPGYPACPEHTVKRDLFRVLDCAEIGMSLTDGFAMLPAASVSGFYFSHPQSSYFNIGQIGEDQLKDYLARSGRDEAELRRALAPVL